ncbi:hypothetical protein SPHINGO391_120012 [Sphingomonas aurantiaca]|uniref:Uncharacterized protein n=1 Tax=Sphingomonas aurantiaca TaxID=185949 RepID=A0A5E7XWH6_9SPHN|nr:hypothetical protein SPHINGO391_120012 [Sphingomonas aurantiaca]
MPVQHGIGFRCLDHLASVWRELPFDPAGFASILFGLFARPRDEREAKCRLLTPPGFIIDGEQCPMKFLQHVRDSLVTLMAPPNVSLSNSMRLIFPRITPSR